MFSLYYCLFYLLYLVYPHPCLPEPEIAMFAVLNPNPAYLSKRTKQEKRSGPLRLDAANKLHLLR